MGAQLLVAARGEEMGVHLDPDPPPIPAPLPQLQRHELHGVPVGDADVALRVAAQVVGLEEGREAGAGDVHLAPDPERLLGVEGQRDHLVNVVGGRVVAGEVVHVAGIADEQHVDPGRVHAALHIGDPLPGTPLARRAAPHSP